MKGRVEIHEMGNLHQNQQLDVNRRKGSVEMAA